MIYKVFHTLVLLVNRYLKRVLASIALILVSGGASVINDLGLKHNPAGYNTYLVLTYAPVIIVVLIILFTIIQLIIERSRNNLIQEHMFVNCYYDTIDRYQLVTRQILRNAGNTSISELVGIKEGFLNKPYDISINSNVSDSLVGHNINLSDHASEKERLLVNGGRPDRVHLFEWHADIVPPISPKETIQINTIISSKGVESDAFKNSGTCFAWRLFYKTIHLTIYIHAPAGYIAILFDHSTTDESGKEITSLKYRSGNPKVINNGTLIQWDVYFPEQHLRYGMRYKFEQLC